MLTLKMLKEMEPNSIIATGLAIDDESGINMFGSGKELKWVAVRGGYHDWCIYFYYSYYDIDWILRSGDKVYSDENIKKLVPCDDEALEMYRK